jgi:Holliday junction resolvase
MANRNRTAGHNYERQIAQELRKLGFEAVTSRYESRSLDDSGVDLASNFPLNPQMKVSINQPNVHELMTTTDAEILFFKKVLKVGYKFMGKGEYVMMRKEDFYKKFL